MLSIANQVLSACVLALVFFGPGPLSAVEPERATTVRLSVEPEVVHLENARARQQLLVTAHRADPYLEDATRKVSFASDDPSIAHVDETGVVRPSRMGTTTLRIAGLDQTASVKVIVGDLTGTPPVSLTNEVMAVLGKAGCNAGACHGHNSGKGGLKLSLRGYDPLFDLKAITRGQLGRRINRLVPEESLLLRKPTGGIAHEGGLRFSTSSDSYRVLRDWLKEGAKADLGQAPRLERIEVSPDYRLLPRPEMSQQLQVRARFVDGSIRDVTDQAIYELSHEGVVEVNPQGVVTAKREGEAAILVRFLGQMGLSRFVVIKHQPDFAWIEPPVQNFIDKHVWTKLRQIQVTPSELSHDAEILRRVSFDAVGLPPTPDEVRAFLADRRPDKRARKVDELLDRQEFGDVWAAHWLELSGTTEDGDSARFKGMWTLSMWLQESINRNLPYDQFVRSLVAGKGSSFTNPAVNFGNNRLAKVEVVPQLFLGIRLECAQCHDHPFDLWKQRDYRAMGEFFTGLGKKSGPHDTYSSELTLFVPPETSLPWEKDKTIALRHLDGTSVIVPTSRDRRETLVDWMFGPAKKQTTRAIVNRVWGKMFGRGIVDPVDDMRFSNPPVNEPLLEALADDFNAHNYDFKHLVRTILNSRTYQLSSVPNATNVREEMNFSHARLRRLPAEQMLDALGAATGGDESFSTGPPGLRAVQIPYERTGSRFLAMFVRPDQRRSPCECIRSHEVTLPQILSLLNGDPLRQKLKVEGGTLERLLAKKLAHDQLVEELYLTILSRLPTDRERQTTKNYFRDTATRAEGAEDLMWALLTSQEFLFNH